MSLRLHRKGLAMASGMVLVFACLYAPPVRAADPLLMFLIGWAKNVIESHLEENARKRALAPVVPPAPTLPAPLITKAPGKMTDEDLRLLVDDAFAYLNRAQRAELLAAVEKTLNDPAHSDQREEILFQFVNVARQVSFTHRQLDRLSASEKRSLAHQFSVNFRTLSPQQQQELLQQLRQQALPLPSDLNEMMLAALASAG